MTKINLSLIETFYALYKGRSYTKAALHLGCTPQNVAQRIKKLEESMGAIYFVKQNRSYVPTIEAEALYNRTYNIFHSLEHEIETLENIPSKTHLDILTTTGASLLWLTTEITNFIKKNSTVTFSVHATEDMTINNIGDFDIIALPQGERFSEFATLFTLEFTSQLYASIDYINEHGNPQNYSELDNHRLISFYHRQEDYRGNPDWLLRLGTPPSSQRIPDLVINNANGIAEAIAGGAGIGPLTLNNPYIKSHNLVPVFPDIKVHSGEMNFCFNTHLGNNAFIRHLKELYPSRTIQI